MLDTLNYPAAITLTCISFYAKDGFREWLNDRRNRRQVPHRLETAGYIPVRNDAASDGLWKVGDRRQAIYGRRDLTLRERIEAAAKVAREG